MATSQCLSGGVDQILEDVGFDFPIGQDVVLGFYYDGRDSKILSCSVNNTVIKGFDLTDLLVPTGFLNVGQRVQNIAFCLLSSLYLFP